MKRVLVIALLVAAAIPLLYAMAELPPHGSPTTPPYTHISPYYLKNGPEEAGAENVVTDVILNYRGFDTEGEVTVIFTSLAAVLAVLLMGSPSPSPRAMPKQTEVPVSVVVRFIVRALAPFIALFAAYVVLNGHVTPGGGFQGGTIAGALVIVLTLVLTRQQADRLVPRKPERVLQAAAPITFFMIALAGLVLFGDYLYYPRSEDLHWLTVTMLVIVEIGIGVGGASVLVGIFRAMGREQ